MKSALTNIFDLNRKRQIGAFIAGMLWGAVIVLILVTIYLRHNLFLEYKSKHNFENTCERIASSAKARGGEWEVKKAPCVLPKTNDEKKILQLSLCNPKYARQILEEPEGKKLASIIPCCFAVYETKEGEIRIARLNTWLVGLILGGKPGRLFSSQIAPDQEKIISDVFGNE